MAGKENARKALLREVAKKAKTAQKAVNIDLRKVKDCICGGTMMWARIMKAMKFWCPDCGRIEP